MNIVNLEKKIELVNQAHSYAKKLYADLSQIFKEYIGKQVISSNGYLLLRIAKKLPEFPNTMKLTVYQDISPFTLRLRFVLKLLQITIKTIIRYVCLLVNITDLCWRNYLMYLL